MSQQRDPGGGGVNVARVIKRLGGEASAIYPVGGAMGALLRQLLDSKSVASDGHLGAALIAHDRILRAKPLAITPLSAVGAGDSFLAALIWQLASGADLAEGFRQAVAAAL